jgi:N6-adenosine-specific RNA methylase IME4
VIYVDPPYKFSAGPSRNPNRHYQTLTIKQIASLPIGDLAHPDGCRLFLWITWPQLYRFPEMLRAWGFKYCSGLPWLKLWPDEGDALFLMSDSFARGTAYEVTNSSEPLIIAKRGKPQRLGDEKFAGHFIAPRRQHSRKPDIVRDLIHRLYDGPRCELFARSHRTGFDVWGDQSNLFDGVAP